MSTDILLLVAVFLTFQNDSFAPKTLIFRGFWGISAF